MKKATTKQKLAIRYCEKWLNINFNDNIEDFYDCYYFLSSFLEDAKDRERELTCEYNAYIIERL